MKTLANLLIILVLAVFASSYRTSAPEQLLPTNLRIIVLNSLGNAEEGVTVNIYETEEDYREEKNPAAEAQQTDKKGRVTFTKLKPKTYFIHAVKDDMTNTGEGVATGKLEEGRMNKVNIVIR